MITNKMIKTVIYILNKRDKTSYSFAGLKYTDSTKDSKSKFTDTTNMILSSDNSSEYTLVSKEEAEDMIMRTVMGFFNIDVQVVTLVDNYISNNYERKTLGIRSIRYLNKTLTIDCQHTEKLNSTALEVLVHDAVGVQVVIKIHNHRDEGGGDACLQ
jgi:hypothetical protein